MHLFNGIVQTNWECTNKWKWKYKAPNGNVLWQKRVLSWGQINGDLLWIWIASFATSHCVPISLYCVYFNSPCFLWKHDKYCHLKTKETLTSVLSWWGHSLKLSRVSFWNEHVSHQKLNLLNNSQLSFWLSLPIKFFRQVSITCEVVLHAMKV